MRSSAPKVVAFAAMALCTAMTMLAGAQTKKKPASAPRPSVTAARPPRAPKAAPPPAEAVEGADDGDAGTSPPRAPSAPSSSDASTSKDAVAVVEQKPADGGAQVFRFSEVEVEGRLKSPQLVYFLRRVRAEFAATDLGHRSFSRELGETRNEPAFDGHPARSHGGAPRSE